MIKYDPLWRTLKEKGISQYQLIKDYGIDTAASAEPCCKNAYFKQALPDT